MSVHQYLATRCMFRDGKTRPRERFYVPVIHRDPRLERLRAASRLLSWPCAQKPQTKYLNKRFSVQAVSLASPFAKVRYTSCAPSFFLHRSVWARIDGPLPGTDNSSGEFFALPSMRYPRNHRQGDTHAKEQPKLTNAWGRGAFVQQTSHYHFAERVRNVLLNHLSITGRNDDTCV